MQLQTCLSTVRFALTCRNMNIKCTCTIYCQDFTLLYEQNEDTVNGAFVPGLSAAIKKELAIL